MSKAVSGVNASVNGFSQLGTTRIDSISVATDSFSSIMNKTTGQDDSKMESTDFQPADSKKADVHESANAMKENTKAAEKIEKSSQTEKAQASEENLNAAEDAVKETAKEVVGKVADALGITEEEVEQAMETLGLTAVDLLDNANLTQLMMNLSGEIDMMALVTNEELYMGIQDIMQSIQEELSSIQEMYGLTEEELNGCVDALKAEAAEQMVVEVEVADDLSLQSDVKTEVGEEVNQTGKIAVEGENVITQETAQLSKESEDLAKNSQGEASGKNDSTTNNIFMQNLTQEQNANPVVNNTEMTMAETQTQDVMDQIMEYMKVQVKADTTNLEMQLHPESLGTVNIRIAAKDGVLTAQFTAQNEAVKNIIEGQITLLQQNLDEQGVKVEAVEVNVAAQQFDRNLEQGKGSNKQASKEAKKKGPRRINLNDLDSLEEEELEEADKVTADMMARNGNTVDYLA